MSELQKILYVEDEPDIQAVARLALESVGGFTVRICSSGQEALDTVTDFNPDLILLDVMMPGMDGPTTLKELKNTDARDKPVIFMTAKVQPQEIEEYMTLGAIGVIPKPFDPIQLSTQVREVWGERMVDMDALEAQLAAIREAFIAELPQREQRIADAWQALAETGWAEEARQTFHREVHSLSGAGATFDCDDLSKHARALEHKFKSLTANSTAATAEEMAELLSLYSKLQTEIQRITGDPSAG